MGNNGIDFSGITLPFSVNDLIASGNGLLAIVSGFVLLALALIFVPRLIRVIKNAFN